MKTYTILLFVIFIVSCKDDEQYKPQKSKGIPNALQEKSVDVSALSKREKADLIEVLYNELIQKDPALKQLEKEINNIQESKADSLKPFTLYEQNNAEYYSTYENHLKDIQDSLLRLRMKKILDSSLIKYRKKFKKEKEISDSTNELYTALSDLQWILKLSKTLAVMENYQDENMPDTAALKKTMEKLKIIIKKTDSLAKQKPVSTPTVE
jgi:hypothetical protein